MTTRIAGVFVLAALVGCNQDVNLNGTDAGSMEVIPDSGHPAFDGGTTWQEQLVTAHNSVRAAAMPVPAPALPAMTWSTSVATAAQTVADRCKFQHDTTGGYGQNLYASTSDGASTEVVSSWTDERASYTYDTNTCANGQTCGHYTQVVWRSSTSVGCGKATCTANPPLSGWTTWHLWVCNYSGPGNFVGQKPY